MDRQATILTSMEERVFIITIDHPPVNALDPQTLAELGSAVDAFIAEPSGRVAIISSANPTVFVSGADIAAFSELAEVGNVHDFIVKGQRLFRKISRCSKPIIAAINGIALGGGLELALACQIRILSERAKLGFPEINLGIMPGWGGTQVLTRMAGTAKAIELILLGETISAQEALRLNLVNRVVPRNEVLPAARELARKLASKSSLASQAVLESIIKGIETDLDAGLAYEAERLASLLATEDAREGVRAFLEKRQPVYKSL